LKKIAGQTLTLIPAQEHEDEMAMHTTMIGSGKFPINEVRGLRRRTIWFGVRSIIKYLLVSKEIIVILEET
jgi:hypothetical protein